MAIQQINLGTAPAGTGGDTQRAANTKINQNFSNSSHAASKMVGVEGGRLSLNNMLFKALHSNIDIPYKSANSGFDCNNMAAGDVVRVHRLGNSNLPPQSFSGTETYVIYTTQDGSDTLLQLAVSFITTVVDIYVRVSRDIGQKTWWDWRSITTSRYVYSTTTGTAPNVVVESDGTLKRSSSSVKYKDILTSLELDDESYQKAMGVKPIVYRSKADGDPKHWHYLSFSAEEIGEYDPALTFWQTHETDPETGEQVELEEKEAEGINLNAICAVLHATNIYQDKKLKELEQRLTDLESINEPIE